MVLGSTRSSHTPFEPRNVPGTSQNRAPGLPCGSGPGAAESIISCIVRNESLYGRFNVPSFMYSVECLATVLVWSSSEASSPRLFGSAVDSLLSASSSAVLVSSGSLATASAVARLSRAPSRTLSLRLISSTRVTAVPMVSHTPAAAEISDADDAGDPTGRDRDPCGLDSLRADLGQTRGGHAQEDARRFDPDRPLDQAFQFASGVVMGLVEEPGVGVARVLQAGVGVREVADVGLHRPADGDGVGDLRRTLLRQRIHRGRDQDRSVGHRRGRRTPRSSGRPQDDPGDRSARRNRRRTGSTTSLAAHLGTRLLTVERCTSVARLSA